MSSAVHLLASLHAQSGHGTALEAALRHLVPASRGEAGCLQYELHQDRDTPERFYMLEIWRSAAALEHHRQTEHFLRFGREHGHLLASFELTYHTPLA
jgi:quinol monooxygenase YgiN